ncbi:uncharacterized protein LOC132168562 isoform X2 [Corylus avellana]|uniref:uncharacterized protein LOC132168562 isoform X2 n=1 Tax=Corylus avellana TaxID=13451 RepID=UPI00286B481F|nr:uncharacterized protein LOC132168562 isoform X2 [Corylus avellana]
MGRNISNHSESPVRGRGSPHRRSPSRRSPSRRERSPPTRQRSSHKVRSLEREKHSVHAKSPRHARSSSPAAHSPSHRTKRLRRAQAEAEKERETERARSPSPRTKRLGRAQAEAQKERETERARSSSPQTKQLRRLQTVREVEREHEKIHSKGSDRGRHRERGSERETVGEIKERKLGRHDNEVDRETEREHEKNHGKGSDRGAHRERDFERETGGERKERRSGKDDTKVEREIEREHENNNGRGSDRGTHRERGSDWETGAERKERRSGRDDDDRKSSRSRHERLTSPSDHQCRSKHRSLSPQPEADTRARDEVTNLRGAEGWNNEDGSIAKMKAAEEALEAKETQKPSFELSGKLAAETNRVRGITLLFTEPPDARKPEIRWRLYVFKGGEVLNEPLYIHRQSCYLFGRERRVADIPTDHPSCSKQHAVIQFRQVEKEEGDGTLTKKPRVCTTARELRHLMGRSWLLQCAASSFQRVEHVDSLTDGNYLQPICAVFSVDAGWPTSPRAAYRLCADRN